MKKIVRLIGLDASGILAPDILSINTLFIRGKQKIIVGLATTR